MKRKLMISPEKYFLLTCRDLLPSCNICCTSSLYVLIFSIFH